MNIYYYSIPKQPVRAKFSLILFNAYSERSLKVKPMAKKENTNGNGTSSGGELTVIRNILMGKQINEYDGRLDSLESQVKEQEIEFQKKIQYLEQQLAEQVVQSQEDMSMRLSKLENLLLSNMQGVNSKIDQQRNQDRRALGQMLLEMSKRFLE